MYQIELLRFGSGADVMIYDQSRMNELSVVSPRLSLEISEAGSLSFTLPITHPQISELWPLQSFLKVYDDGTEKFYGRILQRSHPTLLGQISFECEGDLSFLLDSEITPYGKDSSGNQITQNLTAEAFFRWCIDQHNADVGNDPRRTFTVGIVNANKRNSTSEYSIASYTQTKSAIESNILDIYGGFLRTRPKPGGGRYIDWIENYDAVNPQSITIGTNMEEQTNEFDANDLFTVIRPVGNDGITITPIDLFPAADMAKYGRIVKSVSFNDADTTADLQAKAQEYKDRMQATLFVSSSIRLVDMHYQDGSVPKLWIGDRFTNIHGLEGSEMVASSLEIDFEAPQNDNLSLKNRRSLDPDLTAEGNRHRSKSFSKSSGKSNAKAAQYFKTLKETGMDLEISAENVWMHGKTLTQNYEEIRQTMDYFESVSSRANQSSQILDQQTQRINNHDVIVRPIEGTAIVKDPYFIANVAGSFEIWEDQTTGKKSVHLIDGAEFLVDDENGIVQNVGTRLNIAYNKSTSLDEFFTAETYEGGTTWTMKNKLAGIVGMYRIETEMVPDPDHPGQYKEKRNLVFIEGGGYKIERNGVEYGLYDEGNLTAGMMVQKINGETQTRIRGDKIQIWGTSSLDNLVGHWEEYSIRDVDEQGNVVFHKGLKYVADAGMRIRRTDDNTGIANEWGVYDEGNLTGGVMVQKINGQTETFIKGTKIHVGDDPSDLNLPDWAQDRDGLIAGKATIGDLAAVSARVGTLEADYVKASSLYSTIGGIKYITGQAISVTGSVSGQNIYADNGDVYIRKFSSQGVPQSSAQMSQAVSAAHITLSGDTYTLHLYDMFGNELTPASGKVMTFSRATALSGAFGSGANMGRLEITASPQGNKYYVNFPKTEPNTLTAGLMITDSDNNAAVYALGEDSGDKNNVYLKTTGWKNGSAQSIKVAKYNHGQYDAGVTAGHTAGYTEGYDACVSNITAEQSWSGNLGYNTTYYVYAKYTNRSTGSKSTAATVTFTTPVDRYNDGYAAGYDACKGTITLEQSWSGDTLAAGASYYVRAKYIDRSLGTSRVAATLVFSTPESDYATGYDACASNITAEKSWSGSLSYSSTYSVYAKYVNRSTGSKSTAATVTFTTPSDRYADGYAAGYDAAIAGLSVTGDPNGATLQYGTLYYIYVDYISRTTGRTVNKFTIQFTTPAQGSSSGGSGSYDDGYTDGYNDCQSDIASTLGTMYSGTCSGRTPYGGGLYLYTLQVVATDATFQVNGYYKISSKKL